MIDSHKEASRALSAASRFLVYAVDHHERASLPEATAEQVRVRRGQAASDVAQCIKHLALAAHWIAYGALEKTTTGGRMANGRTMSVELVAFVRERRRTRSEVAERFWPGKAPNGTVLSVLCELGLVEDDTYGGVRTNLRARVAELEAELAKLRA